MSKEAISELKKDYLYNLLRAGKRFDDRGFEEYRHVKVETNVITSAEGSARVNIGNTSVMVGVKLQPGEPFPDSPEEGAIVTNAELVPLASPSFEPGPPDENAIEIARVVDRGIRSSALDLAELYIEEGRVWVVFVDIHVLDQDGNLMDTSVLASTAALLTAKIPNERYELGEDRPLPMKDVPISATAVDLNGDILFDPNVDEESIASTGITLIHNKEGSLVAIQKHGPGSIMSKKIDYIIDKSSKKAAELRNTLDA